MFFKLFPLFTQNTLWACVGIYAFLGFFQLLVWLKLIGGTQGSFQDLHKRLMSWWVIFGTFTAIFLTRQWCLHFFWMGVSLLALYEYFSIIPKRPEYSRVRLWLYLSIPIQYTFILFEQYTLFLIFIPVYVYLLFPIRMILTGSTDGFLQSIGSYFWGVMMAGYSLSYISYLSVFANQMRFEAGALGLMLYLLFLTEINDAAQYIWGKLFGRHKIVPTISPKKTVEGFIGGVVTTGALSLLIGPLLTPMSQIMSFFMAITISFFGFFGDVTMSALKRAVNIKDFGTLFPGHGGLLDRIDSLIFTAPIFFHLMRWFY